MQVIATKTTITVPVEHGRRVVTLEAGRPYVMHDAEVASGRQAGALERVEPLPAKPAAFDPDAARAGRLVVPFIGGLGDAVSLLPVLESIRRGRPGVKVHVAATVGPGELFSLAPAVGRVVEYPQPLELWSAYDHYLSLEPVQRAGRAAGRPLPEVFAEALGVELVGRRFELALPRAAEAAAKPSSVPLVGIAVGDRRTLRSYPPSMLRDVVSRLVAGGVGVVLLGHDDPAWSMPVCPPVITDMRSRTPTILELAVWLRAVDVVLCHDSFVMHLAGALGRPAVALFAPTSAAHGSPYREATTLASGAGCAPCHQAGPACPRGFDRCVAWDDPAVQPAAVAGAVLQRLRKLGRLRPAAGRPAAAAL